MTPPEPLSPRARSLLDAARDGLGPDDAAVSRMRARILAGAGGGIGVAAATKASALGTGAKIALATIAVAILGGGAWWIVRDPDTTRTATQSATETRNRAPQPSTETENRNRAPQPSTATATATATATETETETETETDTDTAPARTTAPRRPARTATAPSLADEVALVDSAMAALRNADPVSALAAADDHVARFAGRGQLAEEAAAIRVEALCRLGDARWSAAFDDFDLRFPRSAQRPRLSAACKGAP